MDFPKQNIALVDPYSAGHHAPWMVEFTLSLLRAGKEVQAIYPDPVGLENEVERCEPSLRDGLRVIPSQGFPRGPLPKNRVRRVRAALERWSIMESLLRSLPRQPDLVFFAYLDCMLAPGLAPMMVDRAFSYPWTGVYLHPIWTRIGRRLPMQLREGWALRARRCNGVGLLDEGLLPRFERMLPRKQVCQVPDFISERTEASVTGPHAEILRRAAGRTVVGMVGTLQSRKGLATLLRAALDPRGSRFFFVFAGQLSLDNFGEEDRALIRQVQNEAPENCYVRTSSIDCERSFVSIAQACDILFAAYHAFPHSSNILALASLLRRPVIVSQGHLMEERALRYKLGPAIPEADPQATLDAISSLDADLHSPHPHKRFFESYLRVHSRARLQTTMRILIDGDDKAKPEHTEAGSSLPAA